MLLHDVMSQLCHVYAGVVYGYLSKEPENLKKLVHSEHSQVDFNIGHRDK